MKDASRRFVALTYGQSVHGLEGQVHIPGQDVTFHYFLLSSYGPWICFSTSFSQRDLDICIEIMSRSFPRQRNVDLYRHWPSSGVSLLDW